MRIQSYRDARFDDDSSIETRSRTLDWMDLEISV